MNKSFALINKTKGSMSKQYFKIHPGKNENEMSFEMHGCNLSVANGLRRSILMNIQNVAFRHEPEDKKTIHVINNTTALHSEYISHRVSLLPLRRDVFEFPLDSYKFKLHVSQKSHKFVTTDDFQVFVKNDEDEYVLLDTKRFFQKSLLPDGSRGASIVTRFPQSESEIIEELDLECFPVMGCHADGAEFSPITICTVFELDEMKHSLKLETNGTIPCKKIVYEGFEFLVDLCNMSIFELDKIEKDTDTENLEIIENKEPYLNFDFTFKNQTHTFGNMIQSWIYDTEVSQKTGKVKIISYNQPHPLSNSIMIRISLNNDKTVKEVSKFLKKKIEELKDMIVKYKNDWKELF